MKYKEDLTYHENVPEDVQEVYPQEVMEPDFEEDGFEESFEENTEPAENQETTEEIPAKEKHEIETEHLSGFEYVSLKNTLCREYMSDSEGDSCESCGRPCPLQLVTESGDFICRHSLIKTEKDYEECEKLLIEYRKEKSLNRGVLLSHFPDFDLEKYLTDEGRLWLEQKYKGDTYE